MTARLRNTCTRPVELHLTAGVVVVAPLSATDCADEDLALGQVTALCHSGVLAVTAAEQPPAEPTPPEHEPAPRSRSTRRRATGTPAN